jgi:hypothetical protein
MKALTLIVTGLALSSTLSYASSFKDATTHQRAQFVTDSVSSEAKAEDLANKFVAEMYEKDSLALSQKLPTRHRRADKRSFEITSTSVHYKTDLSHGGVPAVQGVIDVKYTYTYRAKK